MRLVDADKLIKDRVENDPVRIVATCVPTAYDVDKVVEEMQDLLWDCYTDSGVGIDRKTGFEAYKREMERILRH